MTSIYVSLFLSGFGQGILSTGLAAAISLSVGQENQGKANGFMGMIMPIGHVISPFVAMPLYMISPEYPYLLGFTTMFMIFIFIQTNSRHRWIRNKGYRNTKVSDFNETLENV